MLCYKHGDSHVGQVSQLVTALARQRAVQRSKPPLRYLVFRDIQTFIHNCFVQSLHLVHKIETLNKFIIIKTKSKMQMIAFQYKKKCSLHSDAQSGVDRGGRRPHTSFYEMIHQVHFMYVCESGVHPLLMAPIHFFFQDYTPAYVSLHHVRQFQTGMFISKCQSFVCSHIDYCNSPLIGLPSVRLSPIHTVLDASVRLVSRLPMVSLTSPLL